MAGWQMNGQVEIYVTRMAEGVRRNSEPHGPGVIEHFLAMEGQIDVGTAHDTARLNPGDMLTFSADRPHHYEAIGGPARGLSVQHYPGARSSASGSTAYGASAGRPTHPAGGPSLGEPRHGQAALPEVGAAGSSSEPSPHSIRVSAASPSSVRPCRGPF